MNTYRDQPASYAGQAAAPEKGAKHWVGYGLIAGSQALMALTWFGIAVASVSLQNSQGDPANPNSPNSGYLHAYLSAFMGEYLFRMIATFGSLIITYNADRYFMSRGAAWASWTVNLLLLFSWCAVDLPFVWSSFHHYSSPNGPAFNSNRTIFCQFGPDGYCRANYGNAVMSIIQDFLIFCTFLYSCYQMARARSNILLTWSEVACINLTALGVCGYLVWTLSSINLSTSNNELAFKYLDRSNLWGSYLINGAFIFALGSAALVSFGATKASRMTALLLNWLSFFTLFPAFLYMARHQNEGSAGQCAQDHFNSNLRCPSLDGVTAGMGVAMAAVFFLGFDLLAVYAQPERADFAIAKGPIEMTSAPRALDATRPSTPINNTGVVNQPIIQNQNDNIGMAPINQSNVQLGQPVYRQDEELANVA